MAEFNPKDVEIAIKNGAIIDLVPGEYVIDGEGDRARFTGYGDNAPLYVNLLYQTTSGTTTNCRLPNSELRRSR